MRAIRHDTFGPPDVLRYQEVEDPKPAPGQVRISVEAAGVHLIDARIRNGVAIGLDSLPDLPMTPGREVAGVVDAVGDGIDASWVGTRVVAHLGPAGGGYAELAVCDLGRLHVINGGVSAPAAVAMIGTGRTAIALLEAARFDDDDVVLVTAAAGGIGALLVQAAVGAGATVVGVAGGATKVAKVRELGATIAVDYSTPSWVPTVEQALGGRDVTVVLDGVGGELGRSALELLGPGGRIVMFGWASADEQPTQITTSDLVARGLTATWAIGQGMLRRRTLRSLEEQALGEATSGRLAPLIHTFPLADAAAAHSALESRATIGKVVMLP